MDRPLFNRFSPIASEADLLLAEVLFGVQLPPSQYAIAEGRYHTLAAWLERDGSPLKGHVELVYGQGGVSQGSSVASRATSDEFDVDAMVQVADYVDRGPAYVLDLLYRSIRGEPGSRYYDVTTRCTRCVQVQYSDNMHVDLTPAVRQAATLDRQSTIFHHRAETPSVPGMRVTGNPYAFTEWFKENTPAEPLFDITLGRQTDLLAKADAEPLPQQVGPHGMSRALASLQLFKRFRNLRYDRRDGRSPPSVLLAKLVAEFRATTLTFTSAVLEHAVALRDRFQLQVAAHCLIRESNPRCAADVLTDRWPSSLYDQTLWLGDLNHLVRQLTRYCREELTLNERQQILADLFGEHAAGKAIRDFAERMGRGKELGENRYQTGTGRLILPAMMVPSAAHARPVPATTYFGGREWHH
jgi:Second Messenger Oligonucleotide or Dinucleotide Synthetase domain